MQESKKEGYQNFVSLLPASMILIPHGPEKGMGHSGSRADVGGSVWDSYQLKWAENSDHIAKTFLKHFFSELCAPFW